MKGKREDEHAKRPSRKKMGTMNIILIIVGVMLFAFTVTMILLFKEYGSIPDTLVTCVFAALGGECGVMGWIKTSKERNRDRSWELEDRKDAKAEETQLGENERNADIPQEEG